MQFLLSFVFHFECPTSIPRSQFNIQGSTKVKFAIQSRIHKFQNINCMIQESRERRTFTFLSFLCQLSFYMSTHLFYIFFYFLPIFCFFFFFWSIFSFFLSLFAYKYLLRKPQYSALAISFNL